MFDFFIFGSNMLNIGLLDNIKSKATEKNIIQFAEVFNNLSNLAVSRFTWLNLPETCNERMMEIILYFYGKELFFNDDELGYLNTQVELTGNQNVYYEFLRREARSINYHKEYTIDNSVLIRNNPTCTPTFYSVFLYSQKIADAFRTLDNQVFLMKHPYLFRCDKKEVNSIRNTVKQIADNEVSIVGSDSFKKAGDLFDVVDTRVEWNGEKIWEHIRNLYNQVYTCLGINNPNNDKRERLIVDEVNANNMVIDMNIETEYQTRKQACEEINNMFGLNVDVKVKKLRDYQKYKVFEDGD